MLEELYSDLVLDHSRNPHNYGDLENATHYVQGNNPLCGDKIELAFIVDNNQIKKIKFKGHGCAISQASASIMTDELMGKTIEEAVQLFNIFHKMLIEDKILDDASIKNSFKRAGVFLNIKNFPMRIKCATLAWHSFKLALSKRKNLIKI